MGEITILATGQDAALFKRDGGNSAGRRRPRERGNIVGLALTCLVSLFFASCPSLPLTTSMDYSSQISADNESRLKPVDAYTSGPARSRAVSAPASLRAGDLKAIVGYLTHGISDPFDVARTLHDWVALNVVYDSEAFASGRFPPQDPTSVIRRGTAVCQGYAKVFQALCELAGIRCQIIDGWAQVGDENDVFTFPEKLGEPNHAWNAVLLDGAWYLVDVTWDAGSMREGKWRCSFETGWFLSPPERMIVRHLPSKPVWQLKRAITTAETFTKFPLLNPQYFEVFGPMPPDLARVNTVGGLATIRLPKPASGERIDFSLWEYPFKNGVNTALDGCVAESVQGDATVVRIAFPKPGRYELHIARTPKDSPRQGTITSLVIAMVGFVATGEGLLNAPIINTLPEGVQLLAPLESPLRANTRCHFVVILPPSSTVAVLGDNSDWTIATPTITAGRYEFDCATPPSGTFTLGWRSAASTNFEVIAWYGITTTVPASTSAEKAIVPSREPGPCTVDDSFVCDFTSQRRLHIRCYFVEEKDDGNGPYQLMSACHQVLLRRVPRGQELRIFFPTAGTYLLRFEGDADGYRQFIDYRVTARAGTSRDAFWRLVIDQYFPADDAPGLEASIQSTPSETGDQMVTQGDGRHLYRTATLWKFIFDVPVHGQRTLLHAAAAEGRAKIASLCVDNGVDPNRADDAGMTPLMVAAAAGHDEVVRMLLSRRADPGLRNKAGKTALDLASSDSMRALLRKAGTM